MSARYEPGYEPQPIDMEKLSPAAREFLAHRGAGFDPRCDHQQRCPRCGRFMAMREERYEAGDADVWHECMRAECQAAEADVINAYWSSFDGDAFRGAMDQESDGQEH